MGYGESYQLRDEVFPATADFSDWSTNYEKTVFMKRMHTCCSVIVVDVILDVGQRA